MNFSPAQICQQKLKQVTDEEQLYQLSERGSTSPVQCEKLVGT